MGIFVKGKGLLLEYFCQYFPSTSFHLDNSPMFFNSLPKLGLLSLLLQNPGCVSEP